MLPVFGLGLLLPGLFLGLGLGLRLRLSLGSAFLPACLVLLFLFHGDQEDGSFLQSRFPQAGVGLVQVILGYTVRLGNAEERLALQNGVGVIDFPVEFHLLRRDGDGRRYILLCHGGSAGQKEQRGQKGDVTFHTVVGYRVAAKSWSASQKASQPSRFFSCRMAA